MPKPSLLVLHCPVGGGHRAAALAIAEAARAARVEHQVVDAMSLAPGWFGSAYVAAHLGSTEHARWLYGAGFDALDRRGGFADRLRCALDHGAGAGLLRFVRRCEARRPGLCVVATHFFPLEVLGAARRAGQLAAPLVGVVTDYAAHAYWAARGVDAFCVAGEAGDDLVRHGIAPASLRRTGIPVRAAFGRAAPARAAQRRTGEARRSGATAATPLRVLVTCGGFGVGPIGEVVRSFAAARRGAPSTPPPHMAAGGRSFPGVELTVVCGANEARVREVRRVAEVADVPTLVLGVERDMAARMSAADVVIGKPGGLTSSECLAAGRPLIAVGTCPGQEARNERWLREHGAAVAAPADRAGAVLRDLWSSGALATMAHRAREASAPAAAAAVLAVACALAGARRAA
jgi:processive 1,2-diacylglycerol beta-glucosyltransferase